MMRRVLKWAGAILLVLALIAFCAFLYLIPPFFVAPPETFSAPMAGAPPPVDGIPDPAERAIAARGRYIVMTSGCMGCHFMNGAQGPDLAKYLAGGGLRIESAHGTIVSRNLTSDPETGLARRTDDEVKRVLRSGVFPDAHMVSYTSMPWANFSHWSEEDRHAVVVYLRHLPPVRHAIPDPDHSAAMVEPGVLERAYAGKNYGTDDR
jgi:hypothetical protein